MGSKITKIIKSTFSKKPVDDDLKDIKKHLNKNFKKIPVKVSKTDKAPVRMFCKKGQNKKDTFKDEYRDKYEYCEMCERCYLKKNNNYLPCDRYSS